MKSRVRIPSRQTGFAAIAAIFLVVVLAALGGFMLSFSNTQHLTSAQDLQGTRAYWAARAGLEWGIGTIVATTACPTVAAPAINGFSVSVSCAVKTYTDVGTVNIFEVTSIASSGTIGSIGYVERSVSASIER